MSLMHTNERNCLTIKIIRKYLVMELLGDISIEETPEALSSFCVPSYSIRSLQGICQSYDDEELCVPDNYKDGWVRFCNS